MVLRNTTVGAIQDGDVDGETVSWPDDIEMEGFSCRHLGGYGDDGKTDIEKRPSKWFVKWLKRNTIYSPQPYKHFAKLLREAGYPSKANAILYAGRERARKEAWDQQEQFRWIGLTLLSGTIGYGLGGRYFRTIWSILFFTILGYLVLRFFLPDGNLLDFFTLVTASLLL